MNPMNQMPQYPKFWNYLSPQDKYQYIYLQNSFNQACTKNKRNMRIDNFQRSLQTLQQYCLRGDGHDWRRCLVCGICWLPDGVAINIRQLTLIVGRCKSSINGSFQKMGYDVIDSRCTVLNAIENIIPILKGNNQETRQWNIRKLGVKKDELKVPSKIEEDNSSSILDSELEDEKMSEPESPLLQIRDSDFPETSLFEAQDSFQFSPSRIDQQLERLVQDKLIWEQSSTQEELGDWLY